MALDHIASFVEEHYKVQHRSGDEWSVLCPVHGDTHASMRINVEKGVGFCHGCGARGGMKFLAEIVGVRWKGDTPETRTAVLLSKLKKLQKGPERHKPRYYPESILERYRFPTPYWTDPVPHGRGYTQDTVEAFELGYDPLNECATIPIRDMQGRLLGVTKRYLSPDADLRYRDPKGFQKAHHLFGAHFVAEHDSAEVVLVEGPTDCIKVWQAGYPSVAQFGSHLTLSQIRILKKLGILKVYLFYDRDKAGRKARQKALGYELNRRTNRMEYDPVYDLRRHFLVYRVKYPRSTVKDPGAMNDQQIRRSICDAKRVM